MMSVGEILGYIVGCVRCRDLRLRENNLLWPPGAGGDEGVISCECADGERLLTVFIVLATMDEREPGSCAGGDDIGERELGRRAGVSG